MTVSDQPPNRLWQDLKTALKFGFWVVLLGPLAHLLLWAAVEGVSVSWGKVVHRYLVILTYFLCYTSLFGAGTFLIRYCRLRPNWIERGLGSVCLAIP